MALRMRIRDRIRDYVQRKWTIHPKQFLTPQIKQEGLKKAQVPRKVVHRLLNLGGASVENKVKLFWSGDEAFKAMWEAISKAKKRVWVETYILDPDATGKKTLEVLEQAARRGCDVRLIYDYMGSNNLSSDHLAPLIDAGAQVIPYNPVLTWPPRVPQKPWHRDHRKMMVIDESLGFCGGMNIGNEYAGTVVGGSGFFRDAHLRVEGSAVEELEDMFISVLKESGVKEPDPYYYPPPRDPQAATMLQILRSNPRRNVHHIQIAMRMMFQEAKHYCHISTPYFIPPPKVKEALMEAASRGVAVRVLTSGLIDVPLARAAAQYVYYDLLKSGVCIYEFYGRTLHAKTINIDGWFSSVGSFNMDSLSHFYNLELMAIVIDPQISKEMEINFKRDLQFTTQITFADFEGRKWYQRLFQWFAYRVAKVW